MTDRRHERTERLRLDAPTLDDLAALHTIYSDPRTHFPSLRHAQPATTRTMPQAWIDAWDRDGLGPWIVRLLDDDTVLGHAGCVLRAAGWWNLGYRFAADTHGQGMATEASRAGLEAAVAVRPEAPVVAYLLEHNVASRKVAEKLGMRRQYRGHDAGNPDPDASTPIVS